MTAALSVLLPFHNAAPHLDPAVSSIRAGSFQNWELIAVDDGSTDTSVQVLQTHARDDSRIRLVRQPHHGLVAALNLGLRKAHAPIVARMDADDVAMPERLKLQYGELARNTSIHLTSCLVEPISEKALTFGSRKYLSWVNSRTTPEQLRAGLYVESPFPHPSVVFRKEAVLALGGYRDYDGPEDYDLWLRMMEAGYNFSKVPEVLLQWRFHGDRLSLTSRRYRKQAFLLRKMEFVTHQIRKGKVGKGRELWIWGAGRHGGQLCRRLGESGISVAGFVDISPKKIGGIRRGLPVVSEKDLKGARAYYLCMVGAWGARPYIRNAMEAKDKKEMEDYLVL